MAQHLKLNDDDDKFIQVPEGGVLIFAGASGVETWIERAYDATVRLVIKAAGVATGDDGVLEVAIEVDGGVAKGQDGPASEDARVRASVSVQVVVKAGEKLNFKAYPKATNAAVLRTVVLSADLVPVATADTRPAERPQDRREDAPHDQQHPPAR